MFPGSGRSLEKEMATHSSIVAWEIPWIEEPSGIRAAALLLRKVAAPGEGVPSQACLRATVLLPEKLPAFPGCLIHALWAPAFPTPPRALFSSFAFQIMLCLAFWRSIPLKSAVSPSWCSHGVRQGS